MTENELLEILGRNIRKLRTQGGFSQQALAKKASIDRTFLASIEAGKKNISFQTLASLITALDCRPIHLFESETDDSQELENLTLNYAAKTYSHLQDLAKNYRNMKDSVKGMKGILGSPEVFERAKSSDLNLELLSLIPLLSDDAQNLLKRFAEGYLEKTQPDKTGKRFAQDLLKNIDESSSKKDSSDNK
jgi:transcriptional regulator with XRE-family HTH domain